MKITKYVHSCLLVETPERIAIFDPGTMSEQALDVALLQRLDDIFITHVHTDHCSPTLIKALVTKFPQVRITGPAEVVAQLAQQGITASEQAPEDVSCFAAPHEKLHPPTLPPRQKAVHYLDMLTHPGDSHSFTETKAILALPMTAPWGSNVRAFTLALELQPKHILPIHDWHWRDEARELAYALFERRLAEQGITFHKLQTGQPVQIDL